MTIRLARIVALALGVSVVVLACMGELLPPAPAPAGSDAGSASPAAAAPAPDARVELRFVRPGQPARTLALSELVRTIPPVEISTSDPYYGRTKRFRALPVAAVLRAGFGPGDLRDADFVLRARDGYAVPLAGARLLEEGACIAFADLDVPAWEPIGPQRAHPGPLYLIWAHPQQGQLSTHPRPWQLAAIEIVDGDALYPHAAPAGLAADAPAALGFRLFRARCIACHAINREGGTVGPDLNVPQSIVEYRPRAQIRAYIRNPRTFRYGAMPAHSDLSDAQLDTLLAYFEAMAARKHDPGAGTEGGH